MKYICGKCQILRFRRVLFLSTHVLLLIVIVVVSLCFQILTYGEHFNDDMFLLKGVSIYTTYSLFTSLYSRVAVSLFQNV